MPTAIEILTFLIIVFTAITAYVQVKLRNSTKPKITRIVSASNGCNVTVTVTNNNIHNIVVKEVYLKRLKLKLFPFTKIKAKISKPDGKDIIVSVDDQKPDNLIIFPPESYWFIKYIILVKTTNGWCSIIYDPSIVKDFSSKLLSEHKQDLYQKSKFKWLSGKPS